MKNFIKNLMKLVFTVASICAFAAAAYYFFKKFVKPAAQTEEEAPAETETASEEPAEDEEKPSVNRKYVNIVLDWDQAQEESTLAEAAPETEEAPAEETASEAEEASEETASVDSSIHLND